VVIDDIPQGNLASYGTIARVANERYGLNTIPRNVGWLRRHLYTITDRDTTLPLHRIATADDERSENDTERTRRENENLRGEEGSLINPVWWNP
jgi:alkylated DNA nucleotide flippase Atl1